MWRRRGYRLPALGVLLAACGLAGAASVPGPAVGGGGGGGCAAARSLLQTKGVGDSGGSDDAGAGVCGTANACCSAAMESGLRDLVQREFRKTLYESTNQVLQLLLQQAVQVQDAILLIIRAARTSTLVKFNETYPHSADLARPPIGALFDAFASYFQGQLSDPELEEAVTVFFDDIFVVAYKDALHTMAPQLSETFAACLRAKRSELRPFKDTPLRMQEKSLHSFGIAKFYLQSLYLGVDVLNTTTHFAYSPSCYGALTRLSYCSLCQDLNEVRPCDGFCTNVMRGCMAPLFTLSPSWEVYVNELQRLATSLQQGNNIQNYLYKININMAEAMIDVWESKEELERKAIEQCGSPGAESPFSAEPHSERQRRRRRDASALRYRTSGDLELTLPQRQELFTGERVEPPPLSTNLRAFNSKVEIHKRFFHSLPADNSCKNFTYHEGDELEECWNGVNVGNYSQPLAGFGLDSQAFNPEVSVPQTPDPLLEEKRGTLDWIRQLMLDKMLTVPSGASRLSDDDWNEGSGSGDWHIYDDEGDMYEYPDFSGSGEHGDDSLYPYDLNPDTGTEPPVVDSAEKDLIIDTSTDQTVPQLDVTPPVGAETPDITTGAPPTKKAAAAALRPAAAAVVACWTLLLATAAGTPPPLW